MSQISESDGSTVVNDSDRPPSPEQAPGTLPAAGPLRLTSPITGLAALLAAGMTVWYAVVTLRGYFWQDDFLYVYRAATQPLLEYLTQNYNGHVMPGQFLLVWLLTWWAPLNWVSAVLPLIALQVLGYVLFWRVLERLFGRRPEILLPFAVFVVSPLSFIATTWWAYALQLIPFQVALAGALYAHVSYLRTGNRRYALQGLLWTLGGLLFWEKALLIAPVLFGVTVALMEGGLLRRAAAAFGRYRRLWVWYAVLVGGYAVVYLRTVTAVDQPVIRGRDVATLAERMVFDTFLPGVLGGPWRVKFAAMTAFEVPENGVLVAAAILAALLVITGLWVGRARAVVVWTLLAVYLACEVVLVATFRLHFIGPMIGQDVRYVADAVPVAALCGALAFLPPHAVADAAALPRGRRSLVLFGFGSVFLVGAILTMAAATPHLDHDVARRYVHTATEALRAQPGTVLYDGPVPADLMIAAFGDDARTSRVIGPLGLDVAFDKPTDDLRILDDTGTPRPVELHDPLLGPPGPVKDCGYPVTRTGVDIPFESTPAGPRQVLRIGYFTSRSVVGTLIMGEMRVRVSFEAGPHYLYLTVPDPPPIVSIDLGNTDTVVCVTDVVIGSPRPKAG